MRGPWFGLASGVLAVAFIAAASASARADGALAMRGVYYKERSTRVMQPMLDGTFSVGEDGEADGHLLIDAITSASVASGAAAEPFSERRVEVGGGYLQRLRDRFRVGASGKFSREPDYDAWFIGGRGDVALADDNLVIGAAAGYGYDQITNEGAPNMRGTFAGELRTVLGSLSISQLLSPRAVLGVTYDISYLRGVQHSPYRSVRVAGVLMPEEHPRRRTRHAAAASLRWLGFGDTTFVLAHRVYRDDWGILGHTPEVRVIKEVDAGLELALRYRFHWQHAADFYEDDYEIEDEIRSDDVKISAFSTHTVAVKMAAYGRAFGLADNLAAWRGEVIFEYVDQNNRFGNAAVVHAALVIPFEY